MSSAETWLDLPEVMRRTRKSKSVIYEQMIAGTFPRPHKRGRQSVWVESEVQANIDQEIATLPRMAPSVGRSMGRRRA